MRHPGETTRTRKERWETQQGKVDSHCQLSGGQGVCFVSLMLTKLPETWFPASHLTHEKLRPGKITASRHLARKKHGFQGQAFQYPNLCYLHFCRSLSKDEQNLMNMVVLSLAVRHCLKHARGAMSFVVQEFQLF